MSHLEDRRRSRAGRTVLLVVAIVVLLTLLIGGWLAWRGLQARDDLNNAADELRQARTAALDGDLDSARIHLSQAQLETSAAREKTSDPVWLLVGALPLVGDTPNAVTTIARQADVLADDVFPQLLSIADAVEPSALRLAGNQIDIDALRRIAPTVTAVQTDLRGVRSALATAADGWVLGPVADVLTEFRGEVDDVADTVDTLARATELLPDDLGANAPRR